MTEHSRRTVRRTVQLATTSPGSGFDLAVSLNPAVVGDDLGPFVDLTLFHMSQPVFRPHPHAGFSAVTYMLPSSDGSFRNRWTGGPDQLIGPGALHWTRAGSGMMHEEVPTAPGTLCRGVQMFVKLPADRELDPPMALHLDADQVAEVSAGPGARVRILAGVFDGTDSGLGLPDELTLLDVHLDARVSVDLPVPRGWPAFAFLLQGELQLGGSTMSEPAGLTFERDGDTVHLESTSGANLLVGTGPQLGTHYARGPFIMSTPTRLDDAQRRFSAGQMGHLTPSF